MCLRNFLIFYSTRFCLFLCFVISLLLVFAFCVSSLCLITSAIFSNSVVDNLLIQLFGYFMLIDLFQFFFVKFAKITSTGSENGSLSLSVLRKLRFDPLFFCFAITKITSTAPDNCSLCLSIFFSVKFAKITSTDPRNGSLCLSVCENCVLT